jgi:transaldolase
MEIWLDTINKDAVAKAQRLGILAGVTTNPSILAKDSRPVKDVINALLDSQDGPVAVQVIAKDAAAMIDQGEKLRALSDRIIVKIPVTQEGLAAIHMLSSDFVPTMATVLFHPNQALMAAMAGAEYIAPYVGRIEKAGEDPWNVLGSIQHMYGNYAIATKILAASIQSLEQVMRCTEMGIDAVTLREEIFNALLADDASTLQSLAQFDEEWKTQSKSHALL